jgi:Nucleotide-diphospho-sugar transferase
VNTGVMFFNKTPAALEFISLWIAEVNAVHSHSDQEALNRLVLRATDLTRYNEVFRLGNIRIKVLACEEYNFYYWPQEPMPSTKIVHCKTDRRAALTDWGKRKW